MLTRGQAAILAMLLLALGAAGFAWWYQLGLRRQTRAFWGTETGMRIARAERVELLLLGPNGEAGGAEETLVIDSRTVPLRARHDVSSAAGLIHARAALLNDAAFRWSETPPAVQDWTHALRLTDSHGESTLLFQLEQRVVRRLDSAESAVLGEKLAAGLATFFAEQEAE